ncbi:hypothetical protein N9R59_00345 [Porticoccaceae bacterium]|jgi:hypothetical protein|nr:hypothetical protein [Porticoccaceae bacterium]
MLITNLKVDCYSTGCYGEKNADGLTLQFMVEDIELDYYTIFNVDCSRSRGPNKGAKRPAGQFSVRKKHLFYKFWHHTCGLPTPTKGLTAFHDCMGKLKAFTFQAETDGGKRLRTDTLRIMSSDNALTTIRQIPDKYPIIFPDKEVDKSEAESDFEEILTTCETNHVISKQGDKKTRSSTLALDTPKTDTSQDWSDQCNNLF